MLNFKDFFTQYLLLEYTKPTHDDIENIKTQIYGIKAVKLGITPDQISNLYACVAILSNEQPQYNLIIKNIKSLNNNKQIYHKLDNILKILDTINI